MAIVKHPSKQPASQVDVLAPLGHNRPPLHIEAAHDFNDALDKSLSVRDLTREKFDQLVASAGRAAAVDEITAGRCGDLVRQIDTALKMIEDARKTTKEPYLEAGKNVDLQANNVKAPLETAKRSVRDKIDTFLREEHARKMAEARRAEEARQAAIAEAQAAAPSDAEPAAPPPPVDVPPANLSVRSETGTLTAARTVKKHRIIDLDKAFSAVRSNSKVIEVIDKVLAQMVRGGATEIPGVEIYEDVAAVIR